MSYTLSASNLSEFEADHIGELLSDYKRRMLSKKLEAMVEDHKDGGGRAAWFDEHIAWHDAVMKKISWVKHD